MMSSWTDRLENGKVPEGLGAENGARGLDDLERRLAGFGGAFESSGVYSTHTLCIPTRKERIQGKNSRNKQLQQQPKQTKTRLTDVMTLVTDHELDIAPESITLMHTERFFFAGHAT